MKRIFSVVIIVLILISSLSFTPNFFGGGFVASASDQTRSPGNYEALEENIESFIQTNLDNRAASFTLNLVGDYIANNFNFINVHTEPLFSTNMVRDYRFKAGNDYNAIAFFESFDAITINTQIETTNGKTSKITLTYTVNWGETAAQMTAVESFAQSKVNELGVSSMGDYDKVKTLHDFVVNFASYDLSYKNAYPYQLISLKTGICQAYAGLLYMLCKKANVDTRIVIKGDGDSTSTGKTGEGTIAHAWNLVKVNGNWYHIDTTWDDPIHNQYNVLQWKYFLKGNNSMSANHFWDKTLYNFVSNADYPTSLPEYTLTPKSGGGSVTASKPKTSTSKASTVTSNATTLSQVSSAQSIVSSESAVSSETISSESSSEAVVVTVPTTNFYSGIKEFFVGGVGKLYNKSKPLFIVIIIGVIIILLFSASGIIWFLRRRKSKSNVNMPTTFGGRYSS